MSERTDCFELNKTKLFEKIRNGLSIVQSTQNLLDCSDDLLFAWDANECCLLVKNWRIELMEAQQRAKVDYQTLMPSIPIIQDIDRVIVSNECSLVALSGPRGVYILELPRRWGLDGCFKDGKEKITCRTYCLDSLLFQNNYLEVRQVRWHPNSVSDATLLVLLNNNTIRVYNHSKLRHVWQVGPFAMVKGAKTSLNDFGEVAVDFDFAPATKPRCGDLTAANETTLNQSNNKSLGAKQDKIEWPIVVLRENGNIYIMLTTLDSEITRLQGPITITPQRMDNYGLESCSIMIIPSLPPTVVIAESNGKLHHALLMDAEAAEHSFNEVDDFILIEPAEYVIHVLETVELELGLSGASNTGPKTTYNCPIHLKRDIINELRYFAYHNAGLHVVTVSFISELQRYLDSESEEDRLELASSSRAEYVLCTKFDSSERINAVCGISLLQLPAGVVLLLASGQVISLKLVIDAQLLVTPSEKTQRASDVDEQESGPSFLDKIKTLLQRNVNQPILANKLASATPHEGYELLNQAIEVLREQYLKRHDLVRTEFAKHINQILLKKEQQLREIQDLEHEREIISEGAHKLAERFEEISDNQELLVRKCHSLLQKANTALPNSVVAEREFSQEVSRINKATKGMAADLEAAKKMLNKQRYHIAKSQDELKSNVYQLPEKQERTITNILTQLNGEITRQVTDAKRINKIVGV